MSFIKLLRFEDSRKVGLGLWIFIVSNLFLFAQRIDGGIWMGAITLSSALVGGGTLMDKYMDKDLGGRRQNKTKDSND